MMGVGIFHAGDGVTASSSNYGRDVGGIAGMTVTAASVIMSGIVAIIGSGVGLSV
ncbi:uncharacterized protein EDB91DRAFT_573675 [Suillus paluster]|uniref:uncharacterized protein n=1 Tax=Suillus paluster TaxID=48578 RepID=UPI001B884B3E|nr:uncharacterized protein EDB91DRAFT_573675 [Suillus paluster]KAG1734864.1 hypothetical protein EDB91DRAFT_573675 [Suillus paluster]